MRTDTLIKKDGFDALFEKLDLEAPLSIIMNKIPDWAWNSHWKLEKLRKKGQLLIIGKNYLMKIKKSLLLLMSRSKRLTGKLKI